MDYGLVENNLKFNIDKIREYFTVNKASDIINNFILDKARYHNYQVIGVNESYYIKKGIFPKAILHLNVDAECTYKEIKLIGDEDIEIVGGSNINLLDSILLIACLLDESTRDFDVLITNNNIQNDDKNYKALKDIIRSNNIINLNLRQARCIADEFSALILSNVKVPVERFEPDFTYKSFKLSLSNLIGGHTSEDIDKVRLNAIKSIIGLYRRIKSKVDIDLTTFLGGNRYDNIPSSAFVEFIVKEEYESDLFDIFNLYRNEYIEKNLKHEPEMDIRLEEIENKDINPITDSSFSHLASFVELVPTGVFGVNQETKEILSSLNLSTARSFNEFINFVVVYRSLSDANMEEMLTKTHLAAKISGSEITSRLELPRWDNEDHTLTEIFKEAFRDLTGEELSVIKTQYSLDSSVIFRDINVKMISLGVKYRQGDDEFYHTKLSEIIEVIFMIDDVLSRIDTY